MSRKLTREEFINKSQSVHGSKYDYSLVEYNGNKHKVTIICKEHGEFHPTPNAHMRGTGCFECGRITKSLKGLKDKDHFVSLATEVHGSLYDYSLVEYTGRKGVIKIICKDHGVFEMSVDTHLRGSKCQKCAIENRSRLRTLEFDDFVIRSDQLHNGKYKYIKQSYTKSNAPVDIVCPDHGVFSQSASSHLAGKGCSKCASKENGKKRKSSWSRAEFLNIVKKVHGNKYSYDKTKYIGYKQKITVTCPIHGDFESWYYNHINGCGCPLCALSYDQPFYIYVMKGDNGLIKIGIARSVERRMTELKKSTPFDFDIAARFSAENYPNALDIEKRAHSILHEFNAGLKDFDGCTEWFDCDVGDAISAVSDVKYGIIA